MIEPVVQSIQLTGSLTFSEIQLVSLWKLCPIDLRISREKFYQVYQVYLLSKVSSILHWLLSSCFIVDYRFYQYFLGLPRWIPCKTYKETHKTYLIALNPV